MKSILANIVRSTLTGVKGCGRQWLLPVSLSVALLFSLAFVFPARAADSVDSDGDGYVTCSGCDKPDDKTCGDCAEGNGAVNPGVAEVCGNDVDDNCDGDSMMPGSPCLICNTSDTDTDCFRNDETGICRTVSITICNEGNTALLCPEPGDGYDTPIPEGWTNPATCHDTTDNDCDGLTDNLTGIYAVVVSHDPEVTEDVEMFPDPDCAAITEVCDGFDNNWDDSVDEGFDVGDACSVGVGECARTGAWVCDGSGGRECTASAGNAKTEAYGIADRCSDGVDNDCDGLTDSDPQCDAPPSFELCDGIDNDGVNGIDDIYTNLGDSCTKGQYDCQVSGEYICTADRLGTECDAVALVPDTESAAAGTCDDGKDNDCDGLTDGDDPSCNDIGADLAVTCALPYTQGKPGSDCEGKHTVLYEVTGGDDPDVYVELLGLNPDGTIKKLLPDIEYGDEVHMKSRIDFWDFKMRSRSQKWWRSSRHTAFAPIPILRVTAREGDAKAVAYCSNIPYLDVIKPNGEVVSVSSSDTIDVTVAMPRVDLDSLVILVNGADILGPDALNLPPAACTAASPCGGPVNVLVDAPDPEPDYWVNIVVENLIIDIAPSVDIPSSNTLTMTLKNLGGGGHIVYVDGEPYIEPPPPGELTEDCHQDDIADAGTVAALDVEITSPASQSIVVPTLVPDGGGSFVPVVSVGGEVVHGSFIAGLKLNGKKKDDIPLLPTPIGAGEPKPTAPGYYLKAGNGMTTANQFLLVFDEDLVNIDMATLVSTGSDLSGTVQRGANKVIADANDFFGNRAFDTEIFSVGTLNPSQVAMVEGHIEKALQLAVTQTKDDVKQKIKANGLTEVQNAFVAGMEESAIDTIFQDVCQDAADEFRDRVEANINGMDLGSITVNPDCSCKVTANLVLDYVNVIGDPVCDAAFSDGKIDVTFALPDVKTKIKAYNYCKTKGLFGECFTKTVIDVWAITYIDDPVFSFTITEEQIETNTPPPEELKSFVIGTLRYPGSLGSDNMGASSIVDPTYGQIYHQSSSTHCWGAGFCSFFEGVAGVFIQVLTFGIVDPSDVFDFFVIDFQMADFENITGSTAPDPTGIGEMKIDAQVVENYGRSKFTPTLEGVEITASPPGLTALFSATFETQSIDPGAEETPGPAMTPATAPQPDQNPGNAFIVMADDSINQMFGSLAESGLKTECVDTGKTFDDLLPLDCEDLTGDNDFATGCRNWRQY
jgi:hypothetical protein